MATTTTKPDLDATTPFAGVGVPAWPREQSASTVSDYPAQDPTKPSQRDALQALLAYSALHDQVRRRKALAARNNGFDAGVPVAEFEQGEQFVLDEVLQLVAQRAVAITGADGLAIALAENNEIVLRASAGTVRPDVGARIDRDSALSGACFRTAQIVNWDDTETDPRVNVQACRKLGARSMVAVPLCGRRRVIGVLEAFSAWPFGFNDSDVRNLSLLAELVLGALKPEDEDRFAESAQVAATELQPALHLAKAPAAIEPPPVAHVAPSVPVPVVPGVDKKLDKKPIEAKVASVAAPAIPEKQVVEKTPKLATAVAAAIAPQFKIAAREPEAEKRRPIALILLICVVITAAFAGGVWWKLKTAQLSSAMIHTEKMPVTPAGAIAKDASVAPPTATAPAPPATRPQRFRSEDGAAQQRDDPHGEDARHAGRRDCERRIRCSSNCNCACAPRNRRERSFGGDFRCRRASQFARFRAGVVQVSASHRRAPLVVGRFQHGGSRSRRPGAI